MATRILVRRGPANTLEAQTLAEGELGYTTDTKGLFIGTDDLEGYIKINSTKNVSYDGQALEYVDDSDQLEQVLINIDEALGALVVLANDNKDRIDALEQREDTWGYLGTSSASYGDTVVYEASNFCVDHTVIADWIAVNYPAQNYAKDFIMRVWVKTTLGGDCGYMYFLAQ